MIPTLIRDAWNRASPYLGLVFLLVGRAFCAEACFRVRFEFSVACCVGICFCSVGRLFGILRRFGFTLHAIRAKHCVFWEFACWWIFGRAAWVRN